MATTFRAPDHMSDTFKNKISWFTGCNKKYFRTNNFFTCKNKNDVSDVMTDN